MFSDAAGKLAEASRFRDQGGHEIGFGLAEAFGQ
jgi:hypothetical protein